MSLRLIYALVAVLTAALIVQALTDNAVAAVAAAVTFFAVMSRRLVR